MLPVDTLNRLLELARPEMVRLDDGRTWMPHANAVLRPARPDTLELVSLQALVDYMTRGPEREALVANNAMVLVQDFGARVELVSELSIFHMDRARFAVADAPQMTFPLGTYMDQERFMVGLQTQFTESPDRETLIQLAGRARADEVRDEQDDGISQSVTVKAGAQLVDRETLPNPVYLFPYRTFREVPQPGSPFLVRVRGGAGGLHFALFEADGGAWKLDAQEHVSAWLREHVPAGFEVIG